MSMNLHCVEVDLVQTPTYITYLCFYSDILKHKPSNWKTIREKYIMWFSENWGNKQQDWDYVNEHRDKLRSFKKLNFSII